MPWILAVILPLWLAMSYTVDTSGLVDTATVNVQGGLDRAVKAAAGQWTPASLAAGAVQIDPAKAGAAFYDQLAANLHLEPGTLQPLPGSGLAGPPQVTLIIHNGPFPYTYSPPGQPGLQLVLRNPGVIAVIEADYAKMVTAGTTHFVRAAAAEVIRR